MVRRFSVSADQLNGVAEQPLRDDRFVVVNAAAQKSREAVTEPLGRFCHRFAAFTFFLLRFYKSAAALRLFRGEN
ncbi:hypothetical protein [Hymenobacter daecheongensis]|uniref:hypothetical protein n=1 Tax=Hymenobacter daecheongensis TaxID=496053 RepID=UPI001161026E|nr:hypothetical protein [Hymenobacter daecheongensis]